MPARAEREEFLNTQVLFEGRALSVRVCLAGGNPKHRSGVFRVSLNAVITWICWEEPKCMCHLPLRARVRVFKKCERDSTLWVADCWSWRAWPAMCVLLAAWWGQGSGLQPGGQNQTGGTELLQVGFQQAGAGSWDGEQVCVSEAVTGRRRKQRRAQQGLSARKTE